MPTGFNPFAIPNVPNVPAAPLPKIDPNAGLTALLAVQNAIARQKAMAARAAGDGGISSKYISYIDLPNENGGFDKVPVDARNKDVYKSQVKQLWSQRINQLAAKDESLQKTLKELGNMSVRGQGKALEKLRQQDFPRLFKKWNVPTEMQPEVLSSFVKDAEAARAAQKDAIGETGVFQSLGDSIKLGWYNLRDAFRSLGKTPEEKFVIDQQRGRERQAVIDSNPHLRDEELMRREGNDSWTDFFTSHPVLNLAESFGDTIGDLGAVVGGQASGAAIGGLVASFLPGVGQAFRPAARAVGAAIGGGLAGAPLSGIALRDRIISEMNAGNLTREQAIDAIREGEGTAQLVGAGVNAIPFGQIGVPFLSRGVNTLLGRAAIRKKGEKAAEAEIKNKLADMGSFAYSKTAMNEAVQAAGQNAVQDALAKKAGESFRRRYAEAIAPTSLELGTLGAANVMGQNFAYEQATGQPQDITQSAGTAFLTGAAMGPLFGVLNAGRPHVPARVPEPDDVYKTSINKPGGNTPGLPPGGNGPTGGGGEPNSAAFRQAPKQAKNPYGWGRRSFEEDLNAERAAYQQAQQNWADAQYAYKAGNATEAEYKTAKTAWQQAQKRAKMWERYTGTEQQQTSWDNYQQQRQQRQQQNTQYQQQAQQQNTASAAGDNPNYYSGNYYTTNQAKWDNHINNGGKRGFTADAQTLLSDVFRNKKNVQDRRVAVGELLADGKITIDDIAAYIDSTNAKYSNAESKKKITKDEAIFNTVLAEEMDVYIDWLAAQKNKSANAGTSGGAQMSGAAQQGTSGRAQQQTVGTSQQGTDGGAQAAANAKQSARQQTVSQQSKNNKINIQNAAQSVESATPEMRVREIAEMMVNDLIHPDDMYKAVQQTKLTQQEKRRLMDAVRRFGHYIRDPRFAERGTYGIGGNEESSASGAGGGSGTAPALGGNERPGQGSLDRANTVGDSTATANTETAAADIANEYLERLARGDKSLEGRRYAGLSAQDTGALAEIADFVRSSPLQLRGEQQAPNRKSGSGQLAEQSAKPDTRERGNQSPASPGEGSDRDTKPTGGDQSDNVKATPAQINVGKKALRELDRLDNVKPDKDDRADLRQLVKDTYKGNKEKLIDEYLSPSNIRETLADPEADLYELRKNILTTRSVYKIKADPEAENMFIEHLGTALDNPRYKNLVDAGQLDEAVDSYLTDRLYPPDDEAPTSVKVEPATSVKIEQGSLLDDVQERVQKDMLANEEIMQRELGAEQDEAAPPTKSARRTKKPKVSKTEIEYAQNVGKIREQLENLSGEQLTEGGNKAAFDGYDYWEAVDEGVRIMEEKAAGKKLAPDEEHAYKMMKKYGIQDLNPVVTENAKVAAKQGQELGMKTTEKGQATITRRNARKKVNDTNSETCGL